MNSELGDKIGENIIIPVAKRIHRIPSVSSLAKTPQNRKFETSISYLSLDFWDEYPIFIFVKMQLFSENLY